jgi:septal ring-binding cell division protein DamX
VQQLPEDAWVMQHAALDSYEEALSFQQSSPFYKDARVMYTKRRDAAPYYIVVTGPYSSRQDAEAETRKHPIMAKSWVRSAKSLKNQYDE